MRLLILNETTWVITAALATFRRLARRAVRPAVLRLVSQSRIIWLGRFSGLLNQNRRQKIRKAVETAWRSEFSELTSRKTAGLIALRG